VLLSLLGALDQFARAPAWLDAITLVPSRLRVVNTYHLFASVTRERVEPEIQLLTDGVWVPAHLRHKPGELSRRPGFVAPHQPRLDFQLWFHGLRFQVSHPEYLVNLETRLCEAPDAVFAAPLPPSIEAVRVAYARYTFTSPEERRSNGRWWRRQELGVTPPSSCAR
jgi:lipase maturation factor 1